MNAPPASDNLLDPPAEGTFISFDDSFGVRFLLVVDTEEEFDWSAPFDRANQRVAALGGMARGHTYFAQAGVRPLYVTDYPVVADARARSMMAQWVADGTADIGAHLHPWVTPPHEEQVNAANSYAGSLPEALERAKLSHLRDRLTDAFGTAPLAYRAGRYGIGPNTATILRDLGFRVDTSVRSRFDYSAQFGPNFSGMPLRPYRTGPDQVLIELPLSTAYVGALRRAGDALYPAVSRYAPLVGGLAKLGLIERVPLSPEGVPLGDAIRAIDTLLADGLRLLMFSFHSPTLEPGNTPYVRNANELDDFYRWWDGVLGHMAKRGVSPASLDQIIAAVLPG
ncbi:MAG: polysaccharide deacetylase family protein [Sphingobium sp.]